MGVLSESGGRVGLYFGSNFYIYKTFILFLFVVIFYNYRIETQPLDCPCLLVVEFGALDAIHVDR